MGKTVRIDAVKVAQSGVVNVEYTVGEGPLPPASGISLEFPNMKSLYDAIAEQEVNISDQQMVLMALASWVKVDPQMVTPSLCLLYTSDAADE